VFEYIELTVQYESIRPASHTREARQKEFQVRLVRFLEFVADSVGHKVAAKE
jgi:hypothetical protein